MVSQKGRVEEVVFVTTCVDQMNSNMIPESFAIQKIPDLSPERFRAQKDPDMF